MVFNINKEWRFNTNAESDPSKCPKMPKMSILGSDITADTFTINY